MDSGIVDMKANAVELQGHPKVILLLLVLLLNVNHVLTSIILQTVHVDSMSGASTILFTFTLDRGITWEVVLLYRSHFILHTSLKYNLNFVLLSYFVLLQSASKLLEERQQDGCGLTNNGFYESKREWLGRRHFLLALEGYALTHCYEVMDFLNFWLIIVVHHFLNQVVTYFLNRFWVNVAYRRKFGFVSVCPLQCRHPRKEKS